MSLVLVTTVYNPSEKGHNNESAISLAPEKCFGDACVKFVFYLYLFVPPIPRWYISNFYKERKHIVQIYNT